jgi:hypothetical protein
MPCATETHDFREQWNASNGIEIYKRRESVYSTLHASSIKVESAKAALSIPLSKL